MRRELEKGIVFGFRQVGFGLKVALELEEGEIRFKSPLLWDFGSQQECPFTSRTYLLYSMMSGRQIESKGNRMVLIFPKSVEFQVRCMSYQIVVIQQFVVSIYQN